jgi:hypothetical protein
MPLPLGGDSSSSDKELKVDITGNQEDEENVEPEQQEEAERVSQILTRQSIMHQGRPDEEWQTFIDQWEADWYPRQDGLSDVKYPLVSTTIRNKLADELSVPANITFTPTGKDDFDKIEITQVVWNHVWRLANTDREITKAMMGRSIFGTYVWFEGLENTTRFIQEPVSVSEKEELKFEKKKLVNSRLVGRAVDVRKFWIDSTADLDDAEDCIEEEIVSMAKIEEWKNNPNFKNLEKVIAYNSEQMNGDKATTNEEKTRSSNTKPMVTLWHYWNKVKDEYIVVANKSVEIRRHPIPYAHKELPYSVLKDETVLGSIYGRGVAKRLQNTAAEIQSARNIMMDGMRMSSTTNLLMGENISVDSVENVFGGNIWNVSGNMNELKELQIANKNTAPQNINNLLMEDATIISGIDNRALVGSPQRTAFEVRVQEQTKLKGISLGLKNMDYWMERWASQRLKNIQQFFTKTYADQIVGENDSFVPTGVAVPIENKQMKKIILKKGHKIQLEEGKGFGILELSGDDLRSSLGVKIKTRSTTPILESIRAENVNNFLNNLTQIVQIKQMAAQTGDEKLKSLDADKLITRSAVDNSLSPDDLFGKKVVNPADIVGQIMGEMPMPPRSPNMPHPMASFPITPGAIPPTK